MSLLADYFKECGIKEIVEDERGFATYCFIDDYCYVEDIYVAPAHRGKDVAKEMLDKISNIARAKGYKFLYGSCVPTANGSTEALQAAFSYGFKLLKCTNTLIIYVKGI